MDFDLEKKNFTFIDREELKLQKEGIWAQIISNGLVVKTKGHEASNDTMTWHLKHGVCLSKDLKLVTLSGEAIPVE